MSPNTSPERIARILTIASLAWLLLSPLLLRLARHSRLDSPGFYVGVFGVGLLAAVLVAMLIIFVPLAVHEIGHLVAGKLVGMRPEVLIIGPWGWKRSEGRMHFFWTGRWLTFDGLAAGIPTDHRNSVKREAISILGGPLASLLLALPGMRVGYYLAFLPPNLKAELPRSDGWATGPWMLLVAAGLLSLLALIGSLLPLRYGPIRSDGWSLWILLKGGKLAKRYAAIAAMCGSQQINEPAAYWEQSWVEDATALPDGSTDDAYGSYYAFLWSVSRRDYMAARKFLDRALAAVGSLPADYRSHLHLEAARFFALYDGDMDAARAHWEKGKGSPLASDEYKKQIQTAVRSTSKYWRSGEAEDNAAWN